MSSGSSTQIDFKDKVSEEEIFHDWKEPSGASVNNIAASMHG